VAIFCSDACREIGPICDFCIHYRDDYEGKDGFAGEGICEAKGIRVMAHESCDDDFHCFIAKEGE